MNTKFYIYFWYESNSENAKHKLALHGKPVEIQTEPIKTLRNQKIPGTGVRNEQGRFIKERFESVEAWDITHFIELDLNDLLDFIKENGAVIVRPIGDRWNLLIGDQTGSFTQR